MINACKKAKKTKTRKKTQRSAMNNAISSPECPWPPGTLAGVKAPPPSHQHLLLSTPPLPSTPTQPCQAAGGRGFTTRGRCLVIAGRTAGLPVQGMAGAAINTTGTEVRGGRRGAVSKEGRPHQRPLRITKEKQLWRNSTRT